MLVESSDRLFAKTNIKTNGARARKTHTFSRKWSWPKDVGWNVEADGLIGAPPITVVVGEEAHPTLFKSLGMLGLGRNRVVCVPVDRQGRIDVSKFPKIDGPTIVCTQAGNVNTGAFDAALRYARKLVERTPLDPGARQLLEQLQAATAR